MNLEISQKLEPQLKQTLELNLSPRMLQMLKTLTLPYIELIEHINKEAEENVMLEVERKDELIEYIKYINSDKKIKKEADFSEIPGLENIGDTSRTLEETLMEQLELENLNKSHYEIGKMLIENVNERGYMEKYPEARDAIMKKLGVSRPTVDKVLRLIQTFEPDGVGARNLKECLLIQIREYNFESGELEEILTNAVSKHLDDIAGENFDRVAKGLGIPESGVGRIAAFIKENLTPNPGFAFSSAPRHVIPSFAIEQTDKGYRVVNLEEAYGPSLNISSRYLKMLEDPKADKETVGFLKEKLQKARDLIENLKKRNETSKKIMAKIQETQSDFFSRGNLFLRPLLQKDLAREFGIHPSTVSRAIAEKYVQTPKGLFPIKFLCPRNNRGFTKMRLKSMIKKMIGSENGASPVSDEELRTMLTNEGAEIARRTVTAYRKELGIPSAKERARR